MREAALFRHQSGFLRSRFCYVIGQRWVSSHLSSYNRFFFTKLVMRVGLWGHSDDPKDVMFGTPSVEKPSVRDIATWNKVRTRSIDQPFHLQVIVALERHITENPEIAENYLSLGSVYADQGRYEEAITIFPKALAVDPQFPIPSAQLAQNFHKIGKIDQATAHYRRLVGMVQFAEVIGVLGTLYLIQQEYEKSVDYLHQALRLEPNSSKMNQNSLCCASSMGYETDWKSRLFPSNYEISARFRTFFPIKDSVVWFSYGTRVIDGLCCCSKNLRRNSRLVSAKYCRSCGFSNDTQQYRDAVFLSEKIGHRAWILSRCVEIWSAILASTSQSL